MVRSTVVTFSRAQQSEDGEGHGRVDQRGNGATMNHAMVLFQFRANVEPECRHAWSRRFQVRCRAVERKEPIQPLFESVEFARLLRCRRS